MKKIKDSIAGILYRLLLIVVKLLPAKRGTKHLLIIKLDEIGDYMLFRNNLKYFKESAKYKDHRITLLGNAAWKSIFDEYDSDTVDDTIWITKKQFNRNLKYRFNMLRAVRNCGASEVVNAVFSRSIILDDGFAFVAVGSTKIAIREDVVNTNRGKHTVNFDKSIYDYVIDCGEEPQFDAIRNNNYYSQLLGTPLPLKLEVLPTHKTTLPHQAYYLIFIGAGNKKERQWPIANFIACAEYVASKTNLVPVICGTDFEKDDADYFVKHYNGNTINMVSKTSLTSFIDLASGAKFMLSVDTGTVHMASSAGCPVVAMYSGVHYKRYGPYPSVMQKQFISVYADIIDEYVKTGDSRLYDSFQLKNEYIRLIQVHKVLPFIEELI